MKHCRLCRIVRTRSGLLLWLTERTFRTPRIEGFFHTNGRRKKVADAKRDGAMGQVIQIEEGQIRDHLGEMLAAMSKEPMNAMLTAEADRL